MMDTLTKELWSHTLDGTQKQVRICYGDLCDITEDYDVLVCSAFQNDYFPEERTLIGNLYYRKNISVGSLAENPEIDLKKYGCWVSNKLEGNYKRIACVELLDFHAEKQTDMADSIVLKSTFSTLRFLLEEMAKQNKEVASIALPILGTGRQGIEACYIIPPLLNQCIEALKSIPQLKMISFYEINLEKAKELQQMCESVFAARTTLHQIFISYSSRQQEIAYKLKKLLAHNNISCWMAPESIPTGSSYQKEIPAALSNISTVLLILSPEAEASRWVQKEIGCTIGARHTLIPYQMQEYQHTGQFNFLLDGEQIFEGYKYSPEESDRKLIALLREKLQIQSIQSEEKTMMVPAEGTAIKDNAMGTEGEVISDYELLSFLTHCAFDPEYADKKHILSEVKKLIKEI